MNQEITQNEISSLRKRKISSLAVAWDKEEIEGGKYLYPVEYSFSRIVWLGQCGNCGQFFLRDAKTIRDLHTHYCAKCKSNKKIINEIGNKYGHLIVLRRSNKKKYTRDAFWECKCDCGNPKSIIVNGCNLRNGRTTSCGCARSKNNQKHYENQIIGNFQLIKNTNKKNSDGSYIWKTKCILCGKEDVYFTTDQIHANLSCGCEKRSKGEHKIYNYLTNKNINFIEQKTFESCRFPDTNYLARFDFYLPDYNLLIEYDGKQHYKYSNSGWSNKENYLKTKEHDNFKTDWCKSNNIKLIRIPYTKYEKLEELLTEQLKEIK